VTLRPELRRTLTAVAGSAGALLITTGLVWALREYLGVPDASPAYLLAVTAVAVGFGTLAAAITAVVAFLLYNFLFTHPVFTLIVADSGQLLNLVLLLVIGIVVGQLAGTQRKRAQVAEFREREAQVLFQVSRALATRGETPKALDSILKVLSTHARLTRARIGLGEAAGVERRVADTGKAQPVESPASYLVLQRRPGDEPARWMRLHQPTAAGRVEVGDVLVLRVPIEARGEPLGAIWAERFRQLGEPGREETRMLANAADQIGQALEQDRLRAEATSAELARRSEAIKTALLDSVSHDLRTPLAAIRAAAGSLVDPGSETSTAEVRETAEAIDGEAERMGRLVGNLLDLSRLEAGGLRADLEPYALDDLIETSLRRLRSRLDGRPVDVRLPGVVPYLRVDAVLFDQVLTNILENALVYAPGARIVISGSVTDDAVALAVEDAGAGVPSEVLARIFEKFYRAPGASRAGRGTGIGLTVVRGLTEAMGGRVSARPSDLGGLAVIVELPRADIDEASE
jgi:two-component system sensor histidine kinase KdpD